MPPCPTGSTDPAPPTQTTRKSKCSLDTVEGAHAALIVAASREDIEPTCDADDMTPEAGTAGALAGQLCAWLDRLFPDAERGARLTQALDERFGDDARAVSADVCREVEAVAHEFSRHFALEYVADGSLVPDTEPPGWPPQDPREVQLRAGSVGEVTRHPDGVGVLALNGLDGVHIAAPYLEAAFALLRGARGVVLDLRRNGGGDPGTVTLVLDWLLGGEPTHISDVIYKDRTRQWWTTGRLGNLATPLETPVTVLVSEGTFSSGEALAYHVQSQGRGRVVGQRTPGAADHITPVRVTDHVRALLPEAVVRDAVTGTNWEGTGVVPDISCEPAEALEAAIEALGRA
jgi:peptidase S41-like protein